GSRTRLEVMKPTQRPQKRRRRPKLARNSWCSSRYSLHRRRGGAIACRGTRTLEVLLQFGRKLLWRTGPRQRLARPALEEDEGRSAAHTDRLGVVQVTQHSLQGVPARHAGREPGPIQLEVRGESDQGRVRVLCRRPLLHLFKQLMVHSPVLALIPGTLGR